MRAYRGQTRYQAGKSARYLSERPNTQRYSKLIASSSLYALQHV